MATSQGGVVGGLIADRLLDTSGETGEEKKSLAKSLGSKLAKNAVEALVPDVAHKPKPKAKGTKKDPLKPQRPNPTGLTAKLTPKPKRRITKKSPPEEEEVEHMDTRAGSQKREETNPSSRNTKKHRKNPTPKRMENIRQEQDQRQKHQHQRHHLHQHQRQNNHHKRKVKRSEKDHPQSGRTQQSGDTGDEGSV